MVPLSVRRAGVVGGWGGGLGLLLGRRGGALAAGDGQRKEERAGGSKKETGRMVRVRSHHLKLYSECSDGLRV